MLTDLTISQFVGLLFGVLLVWYFVEAGMNWILSSLQNIADQLFPAKSSPDETETTS